MAKVPGFAKAFVGRWRIVEMDVWDSDFLDLVEEAHLTFDGKSDGEPRRPDGIFVAPFEAGEIGPDLFRAACTMGLEGLVLKRFDRPYRGGRSK